MFNGQNKSSEGCQVKTEKELGQEDEANVGQKTGVQFQLKEVDRRAGRVIVIRAEFWN